MLKAIPINYDLKFEPNFSNFTFKGKEIINIQLPRPMSEIVLNSAELEIKTCYILFNGKTVPVKTKLDDKNETLVVKLSKKISGDAKLCIDFVGILNDKLLGFYKSQYKDNTGKTKYLATTQFEAADARRAFPCWDEPNVKATFDISIIADSNYTAISNMPIISKKKVGKKHHYRFSKTPVMSTYLLYLGVGDFEFLTSKQGKVVVRVVTTKGNKSRGRFAMDLTKKFLRSYEEYFGIKYPLPKLDMIAIPDFAAGAMENWGAITFRETILLYDPSSSSTKTKQYIAEVISHELAHQWFGNLVTMKWWDDLWLNESFATFMATKIVDKFYPSWQVWDQFLEASMNTAMGTDALKHSHPIHVKVENPAQIREIFDSISYDKGGCVLRMLEEFVGKNNFRKGLKRYLLKHSYKNATTDDLWNSLGAVAKKPVSTVMNTWIHQTGFPIMNVKQKNSNLILKQKRFLTESTNTQTKNTWLIPISLKEGNKKTHKLMRKKTEKIQRKKNSIPVVNSGRTGFYRINYDDELLSRLQPLIRKKILGHVDRWSIQNDVFAICFSRGTKLKNYLDLSKSYYGEDNYLSSLNVANNLYYLSFLTFNENISNEIVNNALVYFRKIFQRLGWEPRKNENPTDALLRSYVITILGKLGDQSIIDNVHRKFATFLRNNKSLHPDLMEPVFTIMAWTGNEKTFNKLLSLYKNSDTQEEKLRFLVSMCNFKQESILKKTLKFSLTKEVRSQNIHLPIMRISGNPYARKIMWSWLKINWKALIRKVGVGNPISNRIVSSIGLFAIDAMESEIRKFFKKNPVSGSERTLEQTLERIRIKSKFVRFIKKEYGV